MAFIGQPFLATNIPSEGLIRLYRLAGDQFVQLDTASTIAKSTVQLPDRPRFIPDIAEGLIWRSATNAFRVAPIGGGVFGPAYTQATSLSSTASYAFDLALSVGKYNGNNVLLWAASTRYPLSPPANSQAQGYVNLETFAAGAVAGAAASTYYRGAPDCTEASISPDKRFYMTVAKETDTVVQMATRPWNATAGWTYHAITALMAATTKAVFSTDSRYIIGVSVGSVVVYEISADEGVTVPTISLKGSTPLGVVPLSVANFGRYYVVGFSNDDGITHNATVFRRSEGTMVPLVTLPGIGQDVLFSFDGTLLIDASTRKAYRRTGDNFVEAVGMMDNLPVGIGLSSLSPHLPDALSRGHLYDFATSAFYDKSVNLNSLKAALLSNANYNLGNMDMAAVFTASPETFGSGWPQGGVGLTNVTATATREGLLFKADKVKQEILGAGITARAGVIYDSITDKPLVYVDFQTDRVIESGSALEIDFAERGFMSITSA